MKIVISTLMFLTIFSAHARRGNDKYTFINVGVPYAKLTSESDTINEIDASTGLAFSYGKRFGKYFALEFSYSDITFAEDTSEVTGVPAGWESNLKLTEIMLGYQIILTRYWAIRMGYNYSQLTRSFDEAGLTPPQIAIFTYDQTFHSFYVGMIANFRLFGNVGMYFDTTYSGTSAYNKISTGAGLQIRF